MAILTSIEQLHALATILVGIEEARFSPETVLELVDDAHQVVGLIAGDQAGEIYDETEDKEGTPCATH